MTAQRDGPTPAHPSTVTVKVADMPEVRAALDAAAAEIARLRAERDEWEDRYYDLLSRCGDMHVSILRDPSCAEGRMTLSPCPSTTSAHSVRRNNS